MPSPEAMIMMDKNQDQANEAREGVSQESNGFDGWNYSTMSQHPGGVESAVQEKMSRIERETMELIEHGSIEDLARALQENTDQLRMLQEKMAEIARLMHAG